MRCRWILAAARSRTTGYANFFDTTAHADNHLKKWSFLYDEDWELVGVGSGCNDVLDTAIYENLRLEMGVSSFANMIEHRGADGLLYTLEPDSPFSQSARA
ncbi:MAG: hypothetical protein ACLTSX_01470 [Collinsella sp.]